MAQNLISQYQKAIDCSIDELASEIFSLANKISSDAKIIYRIKNLETLKKKMVLKRVTSVFDIDDVYGLRILVPTISKSYRVQRLIANTFHCFLDHDYIVKPKTRPDKPHLVGKGLRLLQIIAYKNGVPFEVQITTFEFNDENEKLHDEYYREKYQTTSPI